MPDQPSDQPADHSSDQPSDQPYDPPFDPSTGPTDEPPGQQAFGDAIRDKLEEYEVERRLEEFAHEVEDVVRRGMEVVGAFAHEHRHDVTDFLARAADALDRRTEGRHAEAIHDVRGQLERGFQRIADQRSDAEPGDVAGEAPADQVDDPGDPGTPGAGEADR
jgi:hypothetical protein